MIEELTTISQYWELRDWIEKSTERVNSMHGSPYKTKNFKPMAYPGRITIYRDERGEPKGTMLARLSPSIWDFEYILYIQDLLYAETPRASVALLKEFIDFGKANADDIITMIGEQTNIKGSSLDKLGLEKLEVLYHLRGLDYGDGE